MSTLIPDEKHRFVLATCPDVPEARPSFPIPLQKVGISGKTVWVNLAENNGGHVPFDLRILVDLPADRRGIHMSRIEQAITALYDEDFTSLPQYGRLLASRVLESQKASTVTLELTGKLPVIRLGPVSKLRSVDSIEAGFSIELREKDAMIREKVQVSAGVHHLTACPCTLSYNETLFNRFNDPWPQATHSQRSRTELLVSPPDFSMLPDHRTMLEILGEVLHISQDLLKRPDETELVLKAHRHPQFAEDTVREVARAAGEKFRNTLPAETGIFIKTISLESIHIHDVECCLETSLADIITVSTATKRSE